jgi:hypothetical protein
MEESNEEAKEGAEKKKSSGVPHPVAISFLDQMAELGEVFKN